MSERHRGQRYRPFLSNRAARAGALRRLVLAGLLLGVVPSCAPDRPKKTTLATVPRGYRPGTTAIGDGVSGYAFLVRSPQGERVVVDGIPGPLFRHSWRPVLSPVTRRVFYWASETSSEPETANLVVDGTIVARGFGNVGRLVFSKDGTRWAAVVGMPERRDGEQTERGPVVVLADGKELGRYPDASLPSFSHDGKHLAYLVEAEGASLKLIVDGEERRTFEAPQTKCAKWVKREAVGPNTIPQFRVDYLVDGSLFIFAQDAVGWAVFHDVTRLASYAASELPQTNGVAFEFGDECRTVPAFAPLWVSVAAKAPVAAWWERLPGSDMRWRVVRNGKPVDDRVCTRFWEGHPPELSDDGEHVAYPCYPVRDLGSPTAALLVFNDKEFGPYEGLWGMTVSDDGQHVAYGGADGSRELPWAVYVDDKRMAGPFSGTWRPRFDRTSRHLAWEGEHAIGGRGIVGIDRRRIVSFDEVVWGPQFLKSRVATWVIRRRWKLIRLDVPVP